MHKFAHKFIPVSGKFEHFGFQIVAFIELFHYNSIATMTFAGLLIFGTISCIGDWLGE